VNTTIVGKAARFNICFRDISLTAYAGLVLLRDFVERLGLPDLLNQHLHLKARERGYPEAENILSLCWNLILGGASLRDLNVLRGDAGLCEVLGVESLLAPTTAGEFLRAFSLGDLWNLRRVERLLAARVRPLQKSTCVTFDIDASLYAQCSSNKEGSRKHYNGEVGYYPLFIFWAEERELLASHLQSGNAHAAPKALWLFQQALRQVPAALPKRLRADSEFYSWDLLEFCEAHDILYAITADQSVSLCTALQALPASAWRAYAPGAQVSELWFAPHDHPAHRYVAKRQWIADKKRGGHWRYHVVVTNDRRRGPKKLMQWALGRCAMENLIKEHKRDFGLAKMPTKKFHANWAWLLIGQLAWNLVAWFNRLCLPNACHHLTLNSLRHRLFNVAAKIVHQGRQLFLVLSDAYWFQD
jgi:hypothetical protein